MTSEAHGIAELSPPETNHQIMSGEKNFNRKAMNRGKRAVSILCLTSFTEEGIKHKRGTGYFSGKVVFIARVFITFRETLTTRTTAKIKHKMEIKFFEIFSRKQNFCLENKIFRNGTTTKYNVYKFDGRYNNCCSMPFYAISFYPLLFY